MRTGLCLWRAKFCWWYAPPSLWYAPDPILALILATWIKTCTGISSAVLALVLPIEAISLHDASTQALCLCSYSKWYWAVAPSYSMWCCSFCCTCGAQCIERTTTCVGGGSVQFPVYHQQSKLSKRCNVQCFICPKWSLCCWHTVRRWRWPKGSAESNCIAHQNNIVDLHVVPKEHYLCSVNKTMD